LTVKGPALPMPSRHFLQHEELHIKLKWLMFMRVILVTFLFGVTILVSLRSPRYDAVSSFTVLYFLIGYSYLFTAFSALFYKFVRRPAPFSYVQIMGDIVFITGVLHITGGIDSPFVFLYFLSIISGSLLLFEKGGLIAALFSSLSYLILLYFNTLLHVFSHGGNSLEPMQVYYRTFLNLFSFFVVAFLSNQLARRLKKAGEEIRQKEDNIEDLQAFNENIIQSVTSGLITTDLTGRITSVNLSAEKILQISKEKLLPTHLDDIFSFETVKTYLNLDSLQRETEGFRRFEVTYASRPEHEIILGMTLSLLRNNRGNQQGYLCTFQDLTQFKALEEKIRRNEQLAMVGELAAGIAHEIRNPLASMSGSIQMLRSELDLSDANKRLMDIILKETDRLNNLIGNFLMYARPKPIESLPVHLKELLEETATLLRHHRSFPHSLQIELNCPEEMELEGDATALRQVFWNLATNALEAMPDGGALRISCENVQGGRPTSQEDSATPVVRITFSDTGIGIDPAIQERIFFPFHTTKEGGSIRRHKCIPF
jgi:two-component system sensor histidine kinase PilS (NtrC family)